MFGLTKQELLILKKLSTPHKIQSFLETLPFNFETTGETYMSPRRVLREGKAHCFEGALFAAAALWLAGEKPLLLDLKTIAPDQDHVITLYQYHGHWGAISKTNHAVLRWRDPVYRTVRELAMSYFHEYFLNKNGKKTLRSYSKPFDLKKAGSNWVTAEDDLWPLMHALDDSPHQQVFPEKVKKFVRPASLIERQASNIAEWSKS